MRTKAEARQGQNKKFRRRNRSLVLTQIPTHICSICKTEIPPSRLYCIFPSVLDTTGSQTRRPPLIGVGVASRSPARQNPQQIPCARHSQGRQAHSGPLLRRATNRPSFYSQSFFLFLGYVASFPAAWGGRRDSDSGLDSQHKVVAPASRSTGPGLAPSDRSACPPIGRASHAHAHHDGIRLERTAPRRSASLGRGYRPCDTPADRRQPNCAVGAVLPLPAARWSRRCVGGWTDGCNGQCPNTGV